MDLHIIISLQSVEYCKLKVSQSGCPGIECHQRRFESGQVRLPHFAKYLGMILVAVAEKDGKMSRTIGGLWGCSKCIKCY